MGRADPDSNISDIVSSSKTLLHGLKDHRFLLLSAGACLMAFYSIYLSMNLKLIYLPIINDDHFLGYCSIIGTVAGMLGAGFWGFLGDKYGFKMIFVQIAFFDFIVKFFGIWVSEKAGLVGLFFMLGFNDKGFITIIGPGLVEIFGLELATELLPYKGIAVFAAFISTPLIQLFASSLISYKALLGIFTVFGLIALIISLIFYKNILKSYEGNILIQEKSPSSNENAEV